MPSARNQCFTFTKNKCGIAVAPGCAAPSFLQGKEVPSNSYDIQGEQVGVAKSTGEGEEEEGDGEEL